MDVSLNPLLDNELNQINMNILEVAFARIDREWNMKNVLSPFIRLYYVQSGEAYIEYKKRTVKLEGGNIYLIPSNLEFSYWCDSSMYKLYAHITLPGRDNYDLFSNYKDCIIVIKNVPCLECDQCGEKYYTDEVAEKLEIIVNMAKKLMQEIAVIDYTQAA